MSGAFKTFVKCTVCFHGLYANVTVVFDNKADSERKFIQAKVPQLKIEKLLIENLLNYFSECRPFSWGERFLVQLSELG